MGRMTQKLGSDELRIFNNSVEQGICERMEAGFLASAMFNGGNITMDEDTNTFITLQADALRQGLEWSAESNNIEHTRADLQHTIVLVTAAAKHNVEAYLKDPQTHKDTIKARIRTAVIHNITFDRVTLNAQTELYLTRLCCELN